MDQLGQWEGLVDHGGALIALYLIWEQNTQELQAKYDDLKTNTSTPTMAEKQI